MIIRSGVGAIDLSLPMFSAAIVVLAEQIRDG
jgi:hypothetical protein